MGLTNRSNSCFVLQTYAVAYALHVGRYFINLHREVSLARSRFDEAHNRDSTTGITRECSWVCYAATNSRSRAMDWETLNETRAKITGQGNSWLPVLQAEIAYTSWIPGQVKMPTMWEILHQEITRPCQQKGQKIKFRRGAFPLYFIWRCSSSCRSCSNGYVVYF